MSLLDTVENKIKAVVEYVDGEAIRLAKEAEAVALTQVNAVREEVARLGPLVTVAEQDLKALAAEAGPGLGALITAVKDLLGKL